MLSVFREGVALSSDARDFGGEGVPGPSVGEERPSVEVLEGAGDASRIVGRTAEACRVMMPRLMRDCENMVRCGAGGDMYSSTVVRIAAVISSRDP
jgi:hypothetical protein